MDEIGSLLLTLATPFAIQYAFSWFSKRKQPKIPELSRPPRPKTMLDQWSTYFLIFCALWQAYHVIVPPPSFLRTIGATVDSPSFIVRNQFRDYMTKRFPGWTKPAGLYDQESPSKDLFDDFTFETQIEPLEQLYDKLRASKWRKWYGRFGHKAINDCNWCQDEVDYSTYDLAHFGITYSLVFIALALGTMTWRKANWRIYGFLVMSLPISIDLYCYALTSVDTVFFLEPEVQSALFEITHRIRHFFFLITFLLAAFWNQKDKYTDLEVLQDILKKNGTTYARTMSLRLARAAIFGNGPLRQRFMDFYKQKEAEKEAIVRDAEYQEQREQVLAKNSLPKIIQEANEFSNDVMEMAVQEGVLSSFERVPASVDDYQ